MLVQSIAWLPLLALAALVPGFPFVVGAGMVLSYAALWRLVGGGRRGADWITLGRLLAVAGLLATAGANGGVTLAVWLGLVAAAAADLLDGWWARRFGGSPAGAVLDMEADQFTTLGLAVLAWLFTGVGPWVLLLPAFRWIYVPCMMGRGIPVHDPKPLDGDNRRARSISAVVLILALAIVFPDSPAPARSVCLGCAVLLLAYSYASDTIQLIRRAS